MIEDKNPKREADDYSELHYAAHDGLLEICELIMKNIDEKNPKGLGDLTPLHWATEQGHLEVCQLIISNIQEKIH